MVEIDVSMITAGVSLVGVVASFFYFQSRYNDRISTIEGQLKGVDFIKMQADIAELKMKLDPFWRAIENQVPGMLLKGNPIEPGTPLFTLLSKFDADQITHSEICDLVAKLDEEIKKPGHTVGEVLGMALLSATQKGKILTEGVDCNGNGVHIDVS